MLPDYDKAARLAVRTLLEMGIKETPIFPSEIIKKCKNTKLVPYDKFCEIIGLDYVHVMHELAPAKDAITWRCDTADSGKYYIVGYNAHKPLERMRFTLAHELGHIVCNHRVGQLWWEEEEANHFARHLLFPRPLLAECFSRGMQPYEMNFSNISNCSSPCIYAIQYSRPSVVPGEFNRCLRKQITGFVDNLYYMRIIWNRESSYNRVVPLGRFMEGYVE